MSDTAPHNKQVTLRAAAQRSGLSIHVLRRCIHDGILPAVRINNRYEVDVDDVDGLPAGLQRIRQEKEDAERQQLDAHIQAIVDQAPPLSDEQRKELRSILGGTRHRPERGGTDKELT